MPALVANVSVMPVRCVCHAGLPVSLAAVMILGTVAGLVWDGQEDHCQRQPNLTPDWLQLMIGSGFRVWPLHSQGLSRLPGSGKTGLRPM
jgi:hypothetical protein